MTKRVMSVSIDSALVDRVTAASERDGVSRSAWVETLLRSAVAGGARVEAGATLAPTTPDTLRQAVADIEAGGAVDETSASPVETYELAHVIDGAGGCVGGCDPDSDVRCTVGPTDPRRTGKRARP